MKTTHTHKNVIPGLDIPDQDLVILTGRNNSGKSTILQYLAIHLPSPRTTDYISPRRFDSTNEITVATNQEQILQQEMAQRKAYNKSQAEYQAPDPAREFMGLDDEHREQAAAWHNEYFGELKFEKSNPRNQFSPPKITIDGRLITEQGSGSRAVLVILSRIFDPKIQTLLIDEPEIGVEPRIQKYLFNLLKKVSQGEDGLPKKRIYLATHSHLFLDKEAPKNNFVVSKDSNGSAQIQPIASQEELQDLVFRLLGNSPDDLFFPRNIVVVEGVSDSIFLSQLLHLQKHYGVSVHFADGETKIINALEAIDQMLKCTTYVSLYRKKLCVLVDQQADTKRVEAWKDFLQDASGKRILVLPRNGIEYYYPSALMKVISGLEGSALEKEIDTFIELSRKSRQSVKLGSFTGTKRDLAQDVASRLTQEHLKAMESSILELLAKAVKLADDAE